MKTISALAIVIVVIYLPSQGEQKGPGKTENKVDGILWNFDHLEKSYGIKMKSVKKEDANFFRVLFEFTKDVDNLPEMRHAIKPSKQPEAINYWFFDEDNVAIGKLNGAPLVEGELTGKKGDAFRMFIDVQVQGKKIQKVEARPSEIEGKGKSNAKQEKQ
jgi:hypothetical protein